MYTSCLLLFLVTFTPLHKDVVAGWALEKKQKSFFKWWPRLQWSCVFIPAASSVNVAEGCCFLFSFGVFTGYNNSNLQTHRETELKNIWKQLVLLWSNWCSFGAFKLSCFPFLSLVLAWFVLLSNYPVCDASSLGNRPSRLSLYEQVFFFFLSFPPPFFPPVQPKNAYR